jgi:NADH dehydrogenase [ubiquinone] 1 alpha subcomplex assembly factor 6
MNLPSPSENHRDYCADQVRLYDYHRYFSATFAPEPVRRGLLALYAFNLEIAATRERVSEALLGQMRLQWWRDTVDGIYGGTVRDHAVVTELARATETFGLSRERLDRMIDGRMFDLEEEPPEDINALINYVSATSGALTGLAVEICGRSDLGDNAEWAGRFWGITGLLRAMPHQAAQRRIYLPKDYLRAENIAPEDLIERKGHVDPAPVIRKFAEKARELRPTGVQFPKPVRPAVSYAAIAVSYLRRLERREYDAYAAGLEPSRFGAQLQILRTALSGKI